MPVSWYRDCLFSANCCSPGVPGPGSALAFTQDPEMLWTLADTFAEKEALKASATLRATFWSHVPLFPCHPFRRHPSSKQRDPSEPSLDLHQINRWQLPRARHVPDSVLSPSHINLFSLHNNPVEFGATVLHVVDEKMRHWKVNLPKVTT